MSQEKLTHSLPLKTQPTFYTNFKHPRSTQYIIQNHDDNHLLCPEITEFKIQKLKNMPYIHHLKIDFGKLQRPNHFYFEGNKYQKVSKMTDGEDYQPLLKQEISTKRFKGISNLTQSKGIQQKNTQKKRFVKLQYQNQATQQSRPKYYSKDNKKRKIRLQEVKAYEQKGSKGSNVKKIHSRVVKMMVGGGKVTTKVINYPDNNEYLKLCGLK